MFKGLYTAIVTPFKDNLEVDYDALAILIDEQIEAKVDGIILNGTTAEAATLTNEERKFIIELAIQKKQNTDIKIIAGTGSNSTKAAIELSKEAQASGVDGVLVVNPYYNKPNQNGLYEHFSSIANSMQIPLMLYNIKSRTGVNIESKTLVKLMKIKNIVSIKEASGDIDQLMNFISLKSDNFTILLGDDGLTLPSIALGGNGVVSVVSNIIPKEMKMLVECCLNGNFEEAKRIHYKILPLMNACFLETNPIGVKTILAAQGKIKEKFRPPMSKADDVIRKKIINISREF